MPNLLHIDVQEILAAEMALVPGAFDADLHSGGPNSHFSMFKGKLHDIFESPLDNL